MRLFVEMPKAFRLAGTESCRFTDSVVLNMMSAGFAGLSPWSAAGPARYDHRAGRRPALEALFLLVTALFGQTRSPSQVGQRRYGHR